MMRIMRCIPDAAGRNPAAGNNGPSCITLRTTGVMTVRHQTGSNAAASGLISARLPFMALNSTQVLHHLHPVRAP